MPFATRALNLGGIRVPLDCSDLFFTACDHPARSSTNSRRTAPDELANRTIAITARSYRERPVGAEYAPAASPGMPTDPGHDGGSSTRWPVPPLRGQNASAP